MRLICLFDNARLEFIRMPPPATLGRPHRFSLSCVHVSTQKFVDTSILLQSPKLKVTLPDGYALANAQVDTLRVKLLKLAAVVTRNTRRIRLYLASNWPSADIFTHAMAQLRSG